jgi:aminopeptidase N
MRTLLFLAFSQIAGLACSIEGGLGTTDAAVDSSPTAADVAQQTRPFEHLSHDLFIDPTTGYVDGTARLTVNAGLQPLGSVAALLDRGLTVMEADAVNRIIRVRATSTSAWSYLQLTLDPPLPAGESVEVRVRYRGTPACAAVGPTAYCDLAPVGRIARFQSTTALLAPYLAEQNPLFTQALTLRVPKGNEVVVSAELMSRAEEEGRLVTRWRLAQPMPNGMMIFVGPLVSTRLTGTSPPVSLHHAPGDDGWRARISSWPATILPFLERRMGRRVPFPSIDLVKLASYHRDVGATTTGLIALSDWHGSHRDDLFEEEWAHEFAHLYFGVMAAPADLGRQHLLTEGLVVLEALDYSAERLHPQEDRQRFLARRLREAELLIRYVTDPVTLPAPVLLPGQAAPKVGAPDWTWGYAKSPAILDYLRLTIGETVFATGVRRYLDRCSFRSCTVTDFQIALAEASGADLTSFFQQWVFGNTYPRLSIAFRAQPAGAVDEVAVTLTRAATGGPIPVELWLEHPGGTRDTHAVVLTKTSQTFVLRATGPVRAVRPNPRQNWVLWPRSAVPGDIDFDGAETADDRTACRNLRGRKVAATFVPGGDSLVGVDLTFDPNCDRDGNGEIDDRDLAP